MGRAARKDGEKSVESMLLNKFKPASAKKEAAQEKKTPETLKDERTVLADKGKRIAKDDGVSPRGYVPTSPGNVGYEPNRTRDDRDQIIRQSSRLVKETIEDKIGKGGIEVELVKDGFKVMASKPSVHSDDDNLIQKARAVFRVSMQTPHPNKKRRAFASVEFDNNKDVPDRYTIAQHLVSSEDPEARIELNSRKISAFINTGEVEIKRASKRQSNDGENKHSIEDRKIVFRDFRGNAPVYTALKVNDVSNSVHLLKKAGFELQPRKLDASHGNEDVQGSVYELIVNTAQLPLVDATLRQAGEFKEISRKPKNDEAPNTKDGEVFKNEKQIDDPTKFPGRSSEKNEPSYKTADPEDMAKDSEGHAYDQDQNENKNKWPGRSIEKNREGLPANPEHKPHGDEKPNKRNTYPNMPGPGESEDPQDWPFRTLETGTDWGIGEMLRYENYSKTRPLQLKDVLNKTEAQYEALSQMDTPLGSNAQMPDVAPQFGEANDEIGDLVQQDDTGIMSDGEKVVLVTTKDNLVDLAGIVSDEGAAPEAAPATPPMGGVSTTPDNRGLPGSTASKKKAAEVEVEIKDEDEEEDSSKEACETKTAGGESVPMPGEGDSKFQKTAPSIKDNGDKMDGMDHGKSAEEGNKPKIVPTEEFDKYKVALKLAFPEAKPAFAAAQRIAVLAAEHLNNGKVLNQEQFAEATKIASKMVAKSKVGEAKNPYFVTTAFLKDDRLVLAQEIYSKIEVNDSLKEAAVGGSGGTVPNAEPPKNPNTNPDDMTGLNNGKSDANDSMTGFRSSDEPEAKKDEIGGINKNPEEPNMKKTPRGPEDGMSHGDSSGGSPAVTPSSEYKKSNPTKHMTYASYNGDDPVKPLNNKFRDFREELLNHMSEAGTVKVPHRVFANVRNDIIKDYEQEHSKVMKAFANHEINDVEVGKRKALLERVKLARINVTREARLAVGRKVKASKREADKYSGDGKPDTHFNVKDYKNQYNHQTQEWWDRALEKGGNRPTGGMPQMSLKEDEDKAYEENLYDDDQNFVGRTREKSGGVPAKELHTLRADEGKAWGSENLYDKADDWVGRSAEKAGWEAPTSNEYMLKTEQKKEIEAVVKHVTAKKEGEYKKDPLTPELMRNVLRVGGLGVKDKKIIEVKGGKYAYGTKNVDLISEVVDLHQRGLDELHITYAMSQKHPDALVNVPDILAGYKLAKKGGAENPKMPAQAGEEMKARIAKVMKTAKSVDDKTVQKLLKFTDNDGPNIAEPYAYMSMKDPSVIKDILTAQGKLEDYEVVYYIRGKYGDQFNQWDVDDVIRAYNMMNGSKKKASANPFAVCNESVGSEKTEKRERCINKVKKKNKEEGAPEIPKTPKKDAAESKDKKYHDTSYDKERKDDIASNMPEQKSWAAGDISEYNPAEGHSDEEGELEDWQKPQPTVSSEQANDQPEYNKKDGQLSETVLPQESRDYGTEQAKSPVTNIGHPEQDNDVTFAANDTAYDQTGRFPKANVASPYSSEHITEKIVLGIGKEYHSVQDAFNDAVKGKRYGIMSKAQIHQVAEALKAFGFSVTEPKQPENKTPAKK